jgi:hypothetical protein
MLADCIAQPLDLGDKDFATHAWQILVHRILHSGPGATLSTKTRLSSTRTGKLLKSI